MLFPCRVTKKTSTAPITVPTARVAPLMRFGSFFSAFFSPGAGSQQSSLKSVFANSILCLSLLLPNCGFTFEDLSQPLTALRPTLSQAIASVHVDRLLKSNSYEAVDLSKDGSEKIFNSYLESLDHNRSYFLSSDIDYLSKHYKYSLDDALKGGNLDPAFEIFNLYRKRSEERVRFMMQLVGKGVEQLDFTRQETLELDREGADWLANRAEQEDLWRRQLKDSVLAMKLNEKSEDEIKNLLNKRFTNQLRRLHQTHSEDAFQLYLNAYTQLYDPHTQYFSPQRAENFNINMSLSMEGIGAVLQSEDEYTKVISVVPGGPADKAGQLKPGDKIIGVARQAAKMEDVVGMRLDEVVKLIRGEKGTKVRLEVIPYSASDGKSRVYSIVRETVKLEEQSAQKSIVEVGTGSERKRIGVIEIPAFYIDFKAAQAGDLNYKSTTRDVRRLIAALKREKIDGLVVDLRNNGGGSLQEANQLTGLFIPKGPTVIVKDSRGRAEAQQDPDPKEIYSGPMAVLINRLSASASEIFAGAMQDYRRALVIGGQSFGKGTVQTIQPLNHGQLKLTIAKFYRVSGQSTQNRGVIPDISFPSLFNLREIGESSLPNALPYNEIKPVEYNALESISREVPVLQELHDKRVSKNPDFIYLNKLEEYQKQFENRKEVTLHEKKRKTELQQMRKERLDIENYLRQAKGEKPFKTLEELENQQNDQLSLTNRDKKPEDDALLIEASNILVDWISLKEPLLARQAGG